MTIALELGAKPKQLHAVLLPYPAKGHSIPFLHFAKRLLSMGVIVTFVNPYNHLNIEHFRTLDVLDSTMRIVPLGVPQQEGEACLPFAEHVDELVPDAALLMEKIFAEHPDAPPACIISDMFLGWAQVVANKFNIPRYVLFASPASALATFLHRSALAKQGRLPIEHSKREELVCDIPGVPPTRLAELPSPVQDPDACLYEFYARNSEQMHEATGVLVNTYDELEPSCIAALRQTTYGSGRRMSILPIGPLLPKAYFETRDAPQILNSPDERHPCLLWLDKQPESSVLYVSFGSIAVLSLPQIHELTLGLEASGERFLLVLRNPENNAPLSLPKGFQERTKDRGFLQTAWTPQLEVLSHHAVGGFLTHCGWNSALESICRGVAMLAWPIQAEQAMNARFIVDDVKAGIEVCKVTDDFVTKERIGDAVRCFVRERTSVRDNVRKLQRLAMAAVREGGSVDHNLESFIAELQSQKQVGISYSADLGYNTHELVEP